MGKALDFLIIGAGKSGTTSLAYYLDQHPDICITKPKEPWFFDTEDYDKGLDWYWKTYFQEYNNEKLIGEASSQTLFVPYAADRLKQTCPNAKLIAILREPIARAHSDWWMKYSNGTEKLKFSDAIQHDLRRIERGIDFSNPADWQEHINAIKKGNLKYRCYIDYGYYATQIERFRKKFSEKNIIAITTDELTHSPQKTLEKLLKFLELEIPIVPFNFERKNQARGKHEITASRLSNKLNLKSIIPPRMYHSLKEYIKKSDKGKPPIDPDLNQFLKLHYKREILQLEKIISTDLKQWHDS